MQWKDNHTCSINYEGSSGGMERKSAVICFKRSVELHNLRYKTYWGWWYKFL